jgi:hypothetical protein
MGIKLGMVRTKSRDSERRDVEARLLGVSPSKHAAVDHTLDRIEAHADQSDRGIDEVYQLLERILALEEAKKKDGVDAEDDGDDEQTSTTKAIRHSPVVNWVTAPPQDDIARGPYTNVIDWFLGN